ncbi:hypothetical protein K2173_026983 [Erythroxylum novogranatense]|uniref:Glutaredoxin n=1 Tax=Erythroxylum novogranatense TaxID=1862640 RepID=A0AAV8TXR5_9ROSI|nr:hypothetical protein K2173_026983 [Erythroxylum novogranatense]
MGSFLSSTKKIKQGKDMAIEKTKKLSTAAPVVVFSKTYCGYSKRVKQLLTQLGASFKVVELDEQTDIQGALAEWTSQSTVPNVFIGGKHIGGCDTVMDKHQRGVLLPLLTDAGALANSSA